MNTPTPESQISPVSIDSAITVAVSPDQLTATMTVRPYNLKDETVSKDKLWSIVLDWGIHRERMLIDEIRRVLALLDEATKKGGFHSDQSRDCKRCGSDSRRKRMGSFLSSDGKTGQTARRR